jgi:hypothetical protein
MPKWPIFRRIVAILLKADKGQSITRLFLSPALSPRMPSKPIPELQQLLHA